MLLLRTLQKPLLLPESLQGDQISHPACRSNQACQPACKKAGNSSRSLQQQLLRQLLRFRSLSKLPGLARSSPSGAGPFLSGPNLLGRSCRRRMLRKQRQRLQQLQVLNVPARQETTTSLLVTLLMVKYCHQHHSDLAEVSTHKL